MAKPILVKLGGSTLGSGDTTLPDVVALQAQGVRLVVVHGGGKLISEWQQKLGITAHFEKGLRVTDAASLEVVLAVLAGVVNKQLVSAINTRGGKAIGLCGVDGPIIEATVRAPELGYVGDVAAINRALLDMFLDERYIPVIAPLGVTTEGTILNINADAAAGDIARALEAERLIFLSDVPGVQDERGRVVAHLSPTDARALIDSGVVSAGMIPKVEACLTAVGSVGSAVIVDGRQPDALLTALRGEVEGTAFAPK
ncbi:acetylglutamate kinase [Chloroflexota bacterium]